MKAKKLFPALSFKRLWDKVIGIEDKVQYQEEQINNQEEQINTMLPFPLAIDENGNYGYIKEGADSVTPFKYIKQGTHTGNKNTSYTININEPFNFFALYDGGASGYKYAAILFYYKDFRLGAVGTTSGAVSCGSISVNDNVSVTFTLPGYNGNSGSVTSTYIYGLL